MKTYTLRKVDHSQKSELSADELRGMAKRGELNLEDEILPTGQTTWTVISNVEELKKYCHLAQQAGPRLFVEDIATMMRGLVPVIETRTKNGSGLVISRDGFVLTNRHVVDEDPSVLLHFHNGTSLRATVVHRSTEWDLAILKTPITHSNFYDLEARANRSPLHGEEVVVFGHPLGYEFSLATGHIANPKRITDRDWNCGPFFVQLNATILPGNSGGPTVDRSGGLVGINTWIDSRASGIGFAIPGIEARNYFRRFRQDVADGKTLIPQVENIVSPLRIPPDESIRAAILNLQRAKSINEFEELNEENWMHWIIKWNQPELKIHIFLINETEHSESKLLFDVPDKALDESEIQSATFFQELMELSLALAPSHVSLIENNLPVIRTSRLTEGIEPIEVIGALQDVTISFKAFSDWILKRRENPQTSTKANGHRLDPKQSIELTLKELKKNKLISNFDINKVDERTHWDVLWVKPKINIFITLTDETENRNSIFSADIMMNKIEPDQLESPEALRKFISISDRLAPSFVTLWDDKPVIRTTRIAAGLEPIEVRDSIFVVVNSFNAYQSMLEESEEENEEDEEDKE